MAKTKSAGSTGSGRDSQPKYLGVKLYAGQKAKTGMIIVRQRGTKFLAGKNTKKGGDDTIYAMKDGIVSFKTVKKLKFNGSRKLLKKVNID